VRTPKQPRGNPEKCFGLIYPKLENILAWFSVAVKPPETGRITQGEDDTSTAVLSRRTPFATRFAMTKKPFAKKIPWQW